MEETIKVNLSSVIVKKNQKHASLQDYIEIPFKYLYFFKNTWIKYTDKQEMITYSGGNLTSISDDSVILRNIKGDVFELNKEFYIFYCRENAEQYKALKEILIEREKLEIERRILQEEKNTFIKQKREFFLNPKNLPQNSK